MTTLIEIEKAAAALPKEEQKILLTRLLKQVHGQNEKKDEKDTRPSIRDIQPVSVGKILRPFSPDDDILGEMLEGRRL